MEPQMRKTINPYDPTADPDRHFIWERLIVADSHAFVAGDFALVEDDFDATRFEGIRCGHSANPDDWHISFASLDVYRQEWLASSRKFLANRFIGLTHLQAVLRRCRIDRIDIRGDRAIAHKKFAGTIPLEGGQTLSGSRQTLYRLYRKPGSGAAGWKIVGFLGQLPLDES
jgi:hypothetical protein